MTTESSTAELDTERLERIARLQARRAAPAEVAPRAGLRRRRRHPAANARIAASAVGLSAMFGLVTAYGVAAREPGPELAEVVPTGPAQIETIVIQVRLVGADGSFIASSSSVSDRSGVAVGRSVPTAPAAPAVRVLSAPSAPAPAPVAEATTHGSR